jgi:DNA-3-methyladenine glycosylase
MPAENPDFDFLNGHVATVARRLLGCLLIREVDGQQLVGRIVETEAYHQTDAASHSYKGKTPRTEVMFGPAGRLYVYFTYGMHYCCNVITGDVGEGSAVLIRAVEPIEGASIMIQNRNGRAGTELTNGPAKLCQAFAINKQLNGHDLRDAPLQLQIQPPLAAKQVVQTTRIGISKAKDVEWRFYEKDSKYVSQL